MRVDYHKEQVSNWVAEPSSALDQLRSFSQAVYNFATPQAPAPEDFTYANWQQAWQQVAALAQNERLGLLLDEFTSLRFYYRFLANRQSQLALGIQEQSLAEIKRHLRDFIGANAWEELCREWLLRAGAQRAVPVVVDQVGGAWTRAAQVDVVGVNSMEKTLALGECKWGPEPSGRSVLTDLVAKTAEIVPSQGQWQVYYLGFARAGWTAASHAFAQEVATVPPSGKNWHALGMRLLDLAQVDQDLAAWVS